MHSCIRLSTVNNWQRVCPVLLPESVLDIVVTWNTRDNTNESICEYGIDSITEQSAKAPQGPTAFVDGGAQKATQYIHRVSRQAFNELPIYIAYPH